MFGVREALSLGELVFLDKHSFPIIVLFDNIWREFLDGTREAQTGEEHRVAGLMKVVRELGAIRDRLRVVAFEDPDVLCAIPDSVIVETLAQLWPQSASGFPGWEAVTAQWQAAGAPARFKEFFASVAGLPLEKEAWRTFDVLLERALLIWAQRRPREEPRPSLARALNEVFAIVQGSTYEPSR